MPTTKHKLFKIEIKDDGNFTISKTVEKTLNDFLASPNNVYVNHSITTLTEDVEEFDNVKTICKYVLISIVYKDLEATPLDVKVASPKMKNIVHKQIESREPIEKPTILTDIDKELIYFEKKA